MIPRSRPGVFGCLTRRICDLTMRQNLNDGGAMVRRGFGVCFATSRGVTVVNVPDYLECVVLGNEIIRDPDRTLLAVWQHTPRGDRVFARRTRWPWVRA